MRQRVMIAMALACEPQIDCGRADHGAGRHHSGADLELLKGLQAELGMAVIWITHDLGVVRAWPPGGGDVRRADCRGGAVGRLVWQRPAIPIPWDSELNACPHSGSGERLVSIAGRPPLRRATRGAARFAALQTRSLAAAGQTRRWSPWTRTPGAPACGCKDGETSG